MNPSRLDTLADGIFAIAMTLLVLEIKVPVLSGFVNDAVLWDTLKNFGPQLMTYLLSFAVLFTYWQAHHYIMGVYAKSVDRHLMNINGLFFVFVALLPFSAGLLGAYHFTQTAIIVYGLNVIFIGLTIWWMRDHVLFSTHVDSAILDPKTVRHGTIRTIMPVVFAAIAILVSSWSTYISLLLFTLAVIFNLLGESTNITDKILGFRYKIDV